VIHPDVHPIILLVTYGSELLALLVAHKSSVKQSLPAFLAGALLTLGITIPVAWRLWNPDQQSDSSYALQIKKLQEDLAQCEKDRRSDNPNNGSNQLAQLTIVVIDDLTNLHLSNAKIQSDSFGISQDTDSQGRATFYVPPNVSRLRIDVSKSGYKPKDINIDVFPNAPVVRVRLLQAGDK